METVFNQMTQVLGTTLLHSLWQALVMYALLRIFLACFPSASSANKYNAGLLSLAGSVIWPAVTFVNEMGRHNFSQPIADVSSNILPFIPAHHTSITQVAEDAAKAINIDLYLPYLVTFWLIGIALNSARLLWGWRSIYQVKHNTSNANVLAGSVEKLRRLLKIRKNVEAFVSAHVDVPCIIGYFKPVIILPAAVITQFSAEQIQSILIHEMAHIRRNDYFVNMLQQIIGIVFFFNPFTLLINRIIYSEREHCCDDLVLHITGQPLVYAQTLLQLEESREQNWQLAIAVTGKKYHLLTRIKRIMETKKQTGSFRHILVAVSLLTMSMGTIAWLNPEIKDGKLSIIPVTIPSLLNNDADTVKKHTPAKKSTSANKSTGAGKSTSKGSSTSNNNFSYSYNYRSGDPKLDKLMAEVEKRSEAIGKIYESEDYKKLEKEMEKHSAYIDSFYNRPEFKRVQDSLDSQSKIFDRMNETPEMKDLEKRMEAMGKDMDKYYKSDQYKKLEKALELQSKLLSEHTANKADYDKQRETYNQIAEQMKAYNNSPEIKKQQDDIRAMSKKMHDFYTSDDYKAQREEINRLSTEIRKMSQSQIVKEQNAEIRKLSEQMRVYQKSPEFLKQKAELKQAQDALKAYRNTPEFKKHQEKIQAEVDKLMKDMKYTKADTTSSGK
ncbi:M56 family metallopeptidase [Mucilaginibacter sp. AW1-3]